MKKTWTFDENEIIATAKALGIKLTNAELGSEHCEAWADRVRWAKVCLDEGRLEECQRTIEDANAYAVGGRAIAPDSEQRLATPVRNL